MRFNTLSGFIFLAFFLAATNASTNWYNRGKRIQDEPSLQRSSSSSDGSYIQPSEGKIGRPYNPGGSKTPLEVTQMVAKRRAALGKRKGENLQPHERIFPRPQEFDGLSNRQIHYRRKALLGLQHNEAIPKGLKGIPSMILVRAGYDRKNDSNLTFAKSIQRQIDLYKQELGITDRTMTWTTFNMKDYKEKDEEIDDNDDKNVSSSDVTYAAEALMHMAGPSPAM